MVKFLQLAKCYEPFSETMSIELAKNSNIYQNDKLDGIYGMLTISRINEMS